MGGCCTTVTQTVYTDHVECFKRLIKNGRNPKGFPMFSIIQHDKVSYLKFAHEQGYVPSKYYMNILHGDCLLYSLNNNIPMRSSDEKKILPSYVRHLLSNYISNDSISIILKFEM